jgi:hypothetical protein
MSIDFKQLANWLLQGDMAIQYQVYRDLLSNDCKDLSNRIAQKGWEGQTVEHLKGFADPIP